MLWYSGREDGVSLETAQLTLDGIAHIEHRITCLQFGINKDKIQKKKKESLIFGQCNG